LDVILTKSKPAAVQATEAAGSIEMEPPPSEKMTAPFAGAPDLQSHSIDAAATFDQTAAKKISVFPFEFCGNGRAYIKIWLVNLILTILTLGIYSAWAKVRRKKHVYGSTRINGAAFEYLADPIKVFKGRMIAAVFLVAYMFLPVFR
jgi:hypothetical protein